MEAGSLLRLLQSGEPLSLPHSRPMPSIGPRCHELRIRDHDQNWRVAYRIDPDAIAILAVFPKHTRATPDHILKVCRLRARRYDEDSQ